jgi:AcrR family transcriptional regulator/DNA-binding MarR family transcriptional regulator
MAASKRQADLGAAHAYDEYARERVAELQRARILSAMVEECCERGVAGVSVAHVVSRSGVSRRTFYDVFTDREDCFLAAFEMALSLARERMLAASEGQGSWRERVRAGVMAFLGLLEEEPRLGRVLVCESAAGGSRVLTRRAEAIELVARAVDEGRLKSKGAGELSPLTAEGIVGGALAVIQGRLLAPVVPSAHQSEQGQAGQGRTDRRVLKHTREGGQGDAQPMLALTGPLMSMIVLPYLGSAAARRELARPVAHETSAAVNGSSPATRGVLLADPFKAAGMRLTYRTVRVLIAIAEQGGREPGPSNRLIGDLAGISDQGQISKLLHRLQGIGLIENTAGESGKGTAHAWMLTEKGRGVADSIRAHTEEAQ